MHSAAGKAGGRPRRSRHTGSAYGSGWGAACRREVYPRSSNHPGIRHGSIPPGAAPRGLGQTVPVDSSPASLHAPPPIPEYSLTAVLPGRFSAVPAPRPSAVHGQVGYLQPQQDGPWPLPRAGLLGGPFLQLAAPYISHLPPPHADQVRSIHSCPTSAGGQYFGGYHSISMLILTLMLLVTPGHPTRTGWIWVVYGARCGMVTEAPCGISATALSVEKLQMPVKMKRLLHMPVWFGSGIHLVAPSEKRLPATRSASVLFAPPEHA